LAAANQTGFNAEQFITQTVEQNYSEGYVKGVHNFDALQIYNALKIMDEKLNLLRYQGDLRAMAQLFWHHLEEDQQVKLKALMHSTHSVLKAFPNSKRYQSVIDEIEKTFLAWQT